MSEAELHKKILDRYWPVIEQAKRVDDYYSGREDGVKRICSDVVGDMIVELRKARASMDIKATPE